MGKMGRGELRKRVREEGGNEGSLNCPPTFEELLPPLVHVAE